MLLNKSLELDFPFRRGLIKDAMPDHFGDPDEETGACQDSVAMFNFSFILRLQVSGPDTDKVLSTFCGRDFSDLSVGGIRYALHANADGFLLSDATVWRTGPDQVELMSGRPEDVADLHQIIAASRVNVTDLSDETAVFAVQGPDTDFALEAIDSDINTKSIPYFRFLDIPFLGKIIRVGRLGFTGLPGVEILCKRSLASSLWASLSSKIKPAGMIAADRVRLSAGLALFTQEFQPMVTAKDAGLMKFRPCGLTRGDRSQARVCRVTFSARANKNLQSTLWSERQLFPPEVGTIAVTSAVQLRGDNNILGMGYLAINDQGTTCIEPTGILKNISILQRFGCGLN